ncbi:MAG: folylpolyglutamate synthase/dihydrofolate synthase family protein [Rhodospirillales bacterium]
MARLHPKVIDLSLGRIERLLAALGNPEMNLPPVVHVAGTNGKGSLVAFLRAMMEAAGYGVHAYTSPHLVRFNERIRLNGKIVGDDVLIPLLEECEKANAGQAITYFEITTAAAMLAFSRHPGDVVLLETGLGGRLDATNVVEKPALTAITPVSHDHRHFLGETLAGVAAEKAGIIKSGVTCVSAVQEAAAHQVIAARAGELNSPLFRGGLDWSVTAQAGGLVFDDGENKRHFPRPALKGDHQVQNGGLAVACIRNLDGFTVPDAAITEGLTNVDWPGRLQRLTSGPLAAMLPQGWELWVDGGHNPSAAEALASQARQWSDMPLYLIVGMMSGKDVEGFIGPLAALTRGLRTVTIAGQEGALSAKEAADAAKSLSVDAKPSPGLAGALGDILKNGKEPGRVLITGSLYLVGEVLKENG